MKFVNLRVIFLLFPFFSPFSVFAQPPDDWRSCMTPEDVPTLKCLEVVFGRILFVSSGLIILIFFIMFVIGSFRYLTSGGNPENIKKAQGTLKWALIGIFLFVGSFLILKIIDCLFLSCEGRLFKFEIGEF